MINKHSLIGPASRWQALSVLGLAFAINFLGLAGFSHIHSSSAGGRLDSSRAVEPLPMRVVWGSDVENGNPVRGSAGPMMTKIVAFASTYTDLERGLGVQSRIANETLPYGHKNCGYADIEMGQINPWKQIEVASSATVQFNVAESGRILRASILRSSGNAYVDQALIKSANDCSVNTHVVDRRQAISRLQIDFDLHVENYVDDPSYLRWPD